MEKYRINNIKKSNMIDPKTFISEKYALIYGTSIAFIANINIDAANRGLPLDSIKNILINSGLLLTSGTSLKFLINEVKEFGSSALNRKEKHK